MEAEKYKRIGEGLSYYTASAIEKKWIFNACLKICNDHNININTGWQLIAFMDGGKYYKKYDDIETFIDKSEKNFYIMWDITSKIAIHTHKNVDELWKSICKTPISNYIDMYAQYKSIYH